MQDRGLPFRFGFTLIELLAVVVIVSSVFTIGIVHLTAATDESRLRSALNTWRELDAKARVWSQSIGEGRIVLAIAPGNQLRLFRVHKDHRPQTLAEHALPTELALQLRSRDGGSIAQVEYDCRGCSPDYEVAIALHSAPYRIIVSGLTGWHMELRDQQP